MENKDFFVDGENWSYEVYTGWIILFMSPTKSHGREHMNIDYPSPITAIIAGVISRGVSES